MLEGQRDDGIGPHAPGKAGALLLAPALVRRGIGRIEMQRQEVELVLPGAREGLVAGALVEIEADDPPGAALERRPLLDPGVADQIGRESCKEQVWQYG